MLLSTKGLAQALCLCILTTGLVFSAPLTPKEIQDTSGLAISIEAGTDGAHSKLTVTGSLTHVITDDERQTFHLSDYQLKQDAGKYFGKVPDDAYLHSPTPWNDLYKTYGWPQVRTVLIPTKSEILGVTTESVALKNEIFQNNSTLTANYDVSITDDVSNSATSTWNTGSTFKFEQKITYEVGFLGTGGGGETSINYSQSWGVGGSNAKTVTMGSSSGVTVTLKPRQSVKAVLTATRGVLKARVWYNAYLTGSVAVNYGSTYKGHHFWDLPIENVMESGGDTNSVESTEDIEVGYFSNGKVSLLDSETSETLAVYHL